MREIRKSFDEIRELNSLVFYRLTSVHFNFVVTGKVLRKVYNNKLNFNGAKLNSTLTILLL